MVDFRDEPQFPHRLGHRRARSNLQEAPERDVPRSVLVEVRARVPDAQEFGVARQIGVLTTVGGLALSVELGHRAGVRLGSCAEHLDVLRRERGRCRRVLGDASEPRRLPEDAACGLAAVVRRAVTAKLAEDHSVAQPAAAAVVHGVADLVRSPPHSEAPATERDHFRHEGKALVPSLRIESGKNLEWNSSLLRNPPGVIRALPFSSPFNAKTACLRATGKLRPFMTANPAVILNRDAGLLCKKIPLPSVILCEPAPVLTSSQSIVGLPLCNFRGLVVPRYTNEGNSASDSARGSRVGRARTRKGVTAKRSRVSKTERMPSNLQWTSCGVHLRKPASNSQMAISQVSVLPSLCSAGLGGCRASPSDE